MKSNLINKMFILFSIYLLPIFSYIFTYDIEYSFLQTISVTCLYFILHLYSEKGRD